MATFQPIKDTKANIDALPIIDGQLLITTDLGVNNEISVDTGTTRTLLLKGINVDSALSTTSTNAIANNAITNSIVNTTAEVSAITESNIPCGTLPVKELTTNLNANKLGLTRFKFGTVTTSGSTRTITLDEDFTSMKFFDITITSISNVYKPRNVAFTAPRTITFELTNTPSSTIAMETGSVTSKYIFIGE